MKSLFDRKLRTNIGPMRLEYIQDCATLHSTAFALGWSESEFTGLHHDRSVHIDCALPIDSGRILGFVVARIVLDEAEILSLVIDQSARRSGIGQYLLAQHIDRINSKGVKSVFLEVADDNIVALRLYHRAGFVQIGERPGYYPRKTGSRTALTMRLTIS